MKYFSYLRTSILLLTLLSSKFVIAWPSGFYEYFEITKLSSNSIMISKKIDAPSLVEHDHIMIFLDYISAMGPLVITVPNTRSFVVRLFEKNADSYDRNRSFIYHLPSNYPSIHISGDRYYQFRVKEGNENSFLDIGDIFGFYSLCGLYHAFSDKESFLEEGVEDDDGEEQHILLPIVSQINIANETAVGELMPLSCIELFVRFARCILFPATATKAICMNLMYGAKNTKHE